MISIKTLSLLVYFTYIYIDIIIYILESTSWSSRIFCIVSRVVKDPTLGLPSPCGVVPRYQSSSRGGGVDWLVKYSEAGDLLCGY
jgi:hypothetical protein